MHLVRVHMLLCVLGALCALGLALRSGIFKTKTTCPTFEHCPCKLTPRGAMVACFNLSTTQIDKEMAKVGTSVIKVLSLRSIQITELPVSWFSNKTIVELMIIDCPLREIEGAAIGRIRRLKGVSFTNTNLQELPGALSAAARIMWIYAKNNDMKVLKNALHLPNLAKLDLRSNNIEQIEERFLSGFPGLKHLLLSNNKIRHLSPDFFNRTRRLKTVYLNNNRISAISSLFHNLRMLKNLLLSNNLITNIDELIKSRMPNVKHIDLEGNCIHRVREFASSNAQLEVVALRHNNITYVDPGAFRALKGLIRLDLSWNNLSVITESVFAGDCRLEYINLSRNKLDNVDRTFKNTRLVTELYLSSNRITEIDNAFDGLRSLKKLSLRDNLITHISDNTFRDNTEMQKVDLSGNNIKWVGRDAFRGLVTLTDLLLQTNQLLSLNASARNLRNIRHLDVSTNSLQCLEKNEFENTAFLKSIILTRNNISSVEGAFTGAVRLRTLGLFGNRIELLRRSDFSPSMMTTPNVDLKGNPLLCDCRMAWLVHSDTAVNLFSTPTCEHPPWLKGIPLNNLTEEDFITWRGGCPRGCHCKCTEESLGTRGIVVNCSSAALGHLPKAFPMGTSELDLCDNRLEHLDEGLKKGAPKLKVLSLRNNRLSSINPSLLPKTVHAIDLRDNNLKKLPHSLVGKRNLTSLWLSGNPFLCDCMDYPFRQWIAAHYDVVPDARQIKCSESSNPLVSRKDILALEEKHLCPSAFPKHATYLFYWLLAVFLALSAIYLIYKRRLVVWLHAMGVCSWAHCMDEDDADAEKLFDVFISFSSKDTLWVHEHLLPRLDALGISYCTYERNFKGGFLLQDIIRDAVACSRRTLLLLTQNFVASEWCRWEFRLSHQRALEDNMNRLVIVLVDDVAIGALDEDLRLYVRAANHLRWGEPAFWHRLQRSLPKKQTLKKVITMEPNLKTTND